MKKSTKFIIGGIITAIISGFIYLVFKKKKED